MFDEFLTWIACFGLYVGSRGVSVEQYPGVNSNINSLLDSANFPHNPDMYLTYPTFEPPESSRYTHHLQQVDMDILFHVQWLAYTNFGMCSCVNHALTYYVCAYSELLMIQHLFIHNISQYWYYVLLNIQLICQTNPSTIFLETTCGGLVRIHWMYYHNPKGLAI